MSMKTITAALALAALAGCASLTATPRPAGTATLITATATVESVDMDTREVNLRADDGSLLSVVAGPEVRNLAQLEAGDVVEFNFFESVAVSMADPSDTGEPSTMILAGRTEEGDKPGGMAIEATDMVVTLVSYDDRNFIATIRMADGTTDRVTVPPELRSFAAARGPGARVLVSITDAMAVSIVETAM
jgi:hypothetical protein